uniref:Uncharacterized protein n=1 Tax=Arion vulgaris TaxID=1028688 RepID=A0A0B7BLQ7_9EUPU
MSGQPLERTVKIKRRWRFVGHILIRPNQSITKQTFRWEASVQSRKDIIGKP